MKCHIINFTELIVIFLKRQTFLMRVFGILLTGLLTECISNAGARVSNNIQSVHISNCFRVSGLMVGHVTSHGICPREGGSSSVVGVPLSMQAVGKE
jgi:hypothetical protein